MGLEKRWCCDGCGSAEPFVLETQLIDYDRPSPPKGWAIVNESPGEESDAPRRMPLASHVVCPACVASIIGAKGERAA